MQRTQLVLVYRILIFKKVTEFIYMTKNRIPKLIFWGITSNSKPKNLKAHI